ncbi:hypothetical protein V6N12_069482 [Hibiscus sabdariffa]|uniref:Uncharacterized protein n=1 Tax=Hibiscus sabdariffa TaxID=183260 RepID=A0ABR2FDZ4_9ROSI
MNVVHVRNQKHELTPPRNRDKPVTQKTLCRDLNSSRDFCRGRTRCLCRDIPFVILFKQIVEALAKIKLKH